MRVGLRKSGFGLVTGEGKFLKFDESRQRKALAALKATKKEGDLKAKVDGTWTATTCSQLSRD